MAARSASPTTFVDESVVRLLGQNALRIATLEEENARLRDRLGTAELRQLNSDQSHELIQRQETSDQQQDHRSEAVSASGKYQQLQEAYEELKARHSKCDALIDNARRKYDAARERIKQWAAYIDQQHRKSRTHPDTTSLDAAPSKSRLCITPITPKEISSSSTAAPADDGQNVANVVAQYFPALPTAMQRNAGSSMDKAGVPLLEDRGSDIEVRINAPLPPNRITSSQTTDEEAGVHQASVRDAPGSDDTPIVVFERLRKRKRRSSAGAMAPPRRIKQEPNSAEQPVQVTSDDVTPLETCNTFFHTESSDLDALGAACQTLHTTHQADRSQLRAVSENAVQQLTRDRGGTLIRRHSSLSDGGLPSTVDRPQSKKAKVQQSTPTTVKAYSGQRANPRLHHQNGQQLDTPLRPISSNLPKAPRVAALPGASSAKRTPDGSAHRIALLSEDGDESSQITPKPRGKDNNAAAKTALNQRLDLMLHEPSPDRFLLQNRNAFAAKASGAASAVTRQVNHTRSRRRTPNATPNATKQDHASHAPGARKSPKRPRSGGRALRSRPVESLGLDDFRINPKYLGTHFAFADPIRGKEDRQCLPGCTRPECCGDVFRKAVEIGGVQLSSKTDAEALEQFLGPDHAAVLAVCAPQRRRELTVEAHAFAFANMHGKHRQAFARRSTPPGFWRTDMPTTQEAEEDCRKAGAMERQKVEERWREAMREGGRWLFRDE